MLFGRGAQAAGGAALPGRRSRRDGSAVLAAAGANQG